MDDARMTRLTRLLNGIAALQGARRAFSSASAPGTGGRYRRKHRPWGGGGHLREGRSAREGPTLLDDGCWGGGRKGRERRDDSDDGEHLHV